MRTIFLAIILIGFSLMTTAQTKYFEGTVEYDIRNESFMKGVSDNEIRERMGVRMKLYFKDGDFMRVYYDGSGYVIRKMIYLKDSSQIYDLDLVSMPDTVYSVDANAPFFDSYKIEKIAPETVLGCVCPGMLINAKLSMSGRPEPLDVVLTYFFCYDYPVDLDWHKDMYLWGDVLKEHKSIGIKFSEMYSGLYRQTYTATKVNKESVSKDVFTIDPKLARAPAPK